MIRILYAEDNRYDAELVERHLSKNFRCELKIVDSSHEFAAAINDFQPQIIISDYNMGNMFDGSQAFKIAKSLKPNIPFLFLSGTDDFEVIESCVRSDPYSFIPKDRLEALSQYIEKAISRYIC
jgi:CheY-like chemotaxis protein